MDIEVSGDGNRAVIEEYHALRAAETILRAENEALRARVATLEDALRDREARLAQH